MSTNVHRTFKDIGRRWRSRWSRVAVRLDGVLNSHSTLRQGGSQTDEPSGTTACFNVLYDQTRTSSVRYPSSFRIRLFATMRGVTMTARRAPQTRHDGRFAMRIKRLRMQQGLAQTEVARLAGIPHRTYVDWEREIAVPY